MRGNALADPTVVGLLQSFVLTYWYGHRDDDPPKEIRDWVLANENLHEGPGQSNVKILLMDEHAQRVSVFDSMPRERMRGPWQEAMPRYFAEQLRDAREQLGLPAEGTQPRKLRLPDRTGDERAVRLFVRLDDTRMPAYYAPVVEVVSPADATWQALEWPDQARELPADTLQEVFHHVYPPGVMERQNKQTMYHYRIAASDGTLTLEPAGANGKTRYALLRGQVKLTDEGKDGFSFAGTLALVLEYAADSNAVKSLRGTFAASYPRYDRAQDRKHQLPLTAVFESLPAASE